MESIKKNDIDIIRKQIKREPDNLIGIKKRCPQGRPVVVVTSPFSEENGVFPTTYWLSCPFLVKLISQLEDEGLIRDLTEKLDKDQEFKNKLEKCHQKYAQKRLSLLNKDQIETIKSISKDILKVIKNSGIGGIRKKEINPVGEIVMKKLPPLSKCNENCQESEE